MLWGFRNVTRFNVCGILWLLLWLWLDEGQVHQTNQAWISHTCWEANGRRLWALKKSRLSFFRNFHLDMWSELLLIKFLRICVWCLLPPTRFHRSVTSDWLLRLSYRTTSRLSWNLASISNWTDKVRICDSNKMFSTSSKDYSHGERRGEVESKRRWREKVVRRRKIENLDTAASEVYRFLVGLKAWWGECEWV